MNSSESWSGPSVMSPAPARLSKTAEEVGSSMPQARIQWPFARSESLKASIAAISSSVAERLWASITAIRKRML